MQTEYVISQENKDNFVNYVKSKLTSPSPLKIQKILYFLWAVYAAFYGKQENKEYIAENNYKYPEYLFPAEFEAWMYGPVEADVWKKDKEKENEYKNLNNLALNDLLDNSLSKSARNTVSDFIDKMIDALDKVNDFGLVGRTHKDSAWYSVYNAGKNHIKMDNNAIVNDYLTYKKTNNANS